MLEEELPEYHQRPAARQWGTDLTFNSLTFVVFLPIVLGLYWLLDHRRQNGLLFVASYVFYAAWDYRFLSLMIATTAIAYLSGRLFAGNASEKWRRRVLVVSLLANLGILGFFKYFDFFLDSAVRGLNGLGINANPPTLRIILPIGISFYTFHAISYIVDVYRRHIEPCRDPLSFAVFISFFPQLVAGPIGRAHLQLPQFERPRAMPGRERIGSALFLLLLGLFKKVAIADALAPMVNRAFSSAESAGALQLLTGVYAFAFQIYGDFSGYSDIARGSARLFGIDLPRNFDQPYLSRNIAEFWRTWHISLSSWLRDYLYIGLGGNRRGKLATYRNLMLTMLLGGLWHGAAWTFVVWGGLHGLFLALHRRWGTRPAWTHPPAPGRSDVWRILATFHLVCVAWVFFRADTFSQALHVLGGIVTLRGGSVSGNLLWLLAIAVWVMLIVDLQQRKRGTETPVLEYATSVRALVYGAMGFAIIVFTGGTTVPFIYFQF